MNQRVVRFGVRVTAILAALNCGCDDKPGVSPGGIAGSTAAGTPAVAGALGPTLTTMGPTLGAEMAANIAAPAMPPAVTMEATGAAGTVKIAGGAFAPLAGYEDLGARGYALMTRSESASAVSLQVSGLMGTAVYPAHVHALPCSLSAGGHYKVDPTVEETVPDNELSPAFETDEKGVGFANLSTAHVVREDGMSIVVHDPAADNAKMLCADLTYGKDDPGRGEGEVFPFAAAGSADQNLIGTASLTVSPMGTTVMLGVSGMQAEAEYVSHVHALPCETNDAGGHYKEDPSVMDTVEANELWVPIMADMFGASVTESAFEHTVRPDAQSIVVHRKEGDMAPKVACANFVFPHAQDFATTGPGTLLRAGAAAGLANLTGAAYLARLSSDETRVQLVLTGVTPDTAYGVHVHDRPCAVDAGGGHYKHDPMVADVVESNEVWLPVTSDAAGNASAEVLVPGVLRADAQAVVVHNPDKERVACFELTTAM